MAPTLRSGERVLVNKVGMRLASIARDDVVLFRDPSNEDTVMVKRVIGVPGDTVRFVGNEVEVLPGSASEPPAPRGGDAGGECRRETATPRPSGGPGSVSIALAAGEYFVLGDNRSGSSDSRHWGAVSRDAILGEAVFRVFPWRRIGFVTP